MITSLRDSPGDDLGPAGSNDRPTIYLIPGLPRRTPTPDLALHSSAAIRTSADLVPMTESRRRHGILVGRVASGTRFLGQGSVHVSAYLTIPAEPVRRQPSRRALRSRAGDRQHPRGQAPSPPLQRDRRPPRGHGNQGAGGHRIEHPPGEQPSGDNRDCDLADEHSRRRARRPPAPPADMHPAEGPGSRSPRR